MPRFSMTSRCAVCGKEVSQSGPARQWVHENEFYAKADHPAEPVAKGHVMARTTPDPAPARRREEPTKPKAEGDKPRTVAELRRRLLQGTTEAAPDDNAARKRRVAAIDAAESAQASQTEADLAARRLRMLRLQAQQDQQQR